MLLAISLLVSGAFSVCASAGDGTSSKGGTSSKDVKSSTMDAKEAVELRDDCSLSVAYSSNGTVFSGQKVKVWHVADIKEDATYELAGSFTDYPIEVTGTKSQSEWDALTITFNSYILSDGIAADYEAVTDENGQVSFTSLKAGIYLIGNIRTEQDGTYYVFESFMAAVPDVDESGAWNYEVSASPKLSTDTPSKGQVTYQVVKTWKDSDNKDQLRTDSVSVKIYQDEELKETVTLNAKNDWSYSWEAIDDGSVWTVAEEDVPAKYTVGIKKTGDTFVITNAHTVKAAKKTSSKTQPKTGDSTNVLPYVIGIAAAGVILIIIGIVLHRRRHDR